MSLLQYELLDDVSPGQSMSKSSKVKTLFVIRFSLLLIYEASVRLAHAINFERQPINLITDLSNTSLGSKLSIYILVFTVKFPSIAILPRRISQYFIAYAARVSPLLFSL